MIKRTYAKRALAVPAIHEDEPTKRRRVESIEQNAPSSSPTRTSAIFSDENVPDDWTPPSSPSMPITNVAIDEVKNGSKAGPHEQSPIAPPVFKIAATRQTSKTPTRHENTTRTHIAPLQPKYQLEPAKPKGKTKSKKPLTQMRLDLGQQITKRCRTCGMEYRPSVADDKKLHENFHRRNVDGIPVNNLSTLRRIVEDDERLYKEEIIVPLGRDQQRSAGIKKLILAALEVVETELGGVGIGAEELWSQVQEPRLGERGDDGEAALHDRYKTFLFLRKDKILGVCLAERIFEARAVLPNPNTNSTTDTAIITEESAQQATLGISRIWVSKCARGQGIADKLLRFAAKRFIYRVNIPREQVAFSQPTMSGARLARRFFGKESGWLVYAG